MAFSYKVTPAKASGPFGEQIPFGDPSWYQGCHSPYYTESHIAWRAKCRQFVEDELMPNVEKWDLEKIQPHGLHKRMYDAGIFGAVWPKEFGGTPVDGFDAFHELIWLDEFARCGSWGLTMGANIITMALPPVLLGAAPELKKRVATECITAEKQIALCISEPTAGSDVAAIRTTAVRDGDFYVLNGQKKWITNGANSTYFVVACRTGGSGQGGISMILCERGPGITTEKMPLQGNWTAGTSLVTFENHRTPVGHLLGKENEGFKIIMTNFNHERFVMGAKAVRSARLCLEESIRRARSRRTFGSPLIKSQVIRHKIADMAMKVECLHAFLEHVAYQMKCGADVKVLGRLIALLKVQATRTFKFCAIESTQVFGGSAYVMGGPGGVVERAVREMVSAAIPGGSEEILVDLAMKLSKL